MKKFQMIFFGLLVCAFTLPVLSAPPTAEHVYSIDDVVAIIINQLQAAKKPVPSDIKKQIQNYFPDTPNGPFTQMQVKQLQGDAPIEFAPNPTDKDKKFKLPPLLGIKIRQDYNDVVQEEDYSVESPKAKRNQLSGAALSFSRDFKADQNTWSVQGALIRPIRIPVGTNGYSFSDSITLRTLYITPSVSLHKADAKNPKDDVDDLFFRLGGSARFDYMRKVLDSELEVRAFGTYATDTHFKSSIPAFQFDLEPRFYGEGTGARWALGVQRSLFPHTPNNEHPEDTSEFLYSIRFFGHGEIGSVDDTGGKTNLESGHFFRIGPEAKFEVQPCILARSLGMDAQALSFKVSYSYIPRISGIDPGHASYFSAGLDWAILKNEANNQKVSLKILYETGGLEITKQQVDKLTVGLGVTY